MELTENDPKVSSDESETQCLSPVLTRRSYQCRRRNKNKLREKLSNKYQQNKFNTISSETAESTCSGWPAEPFVKTDAPKSIVFNGRISNDQDTIINPELSLSTKQSSIVKNESMTENVSLDKTSVVFISQETEDYFMNLTNVINDSKETSKLSVEKAGKRLSTDSDELLSKKFKWDNEAIETFTNVAPQYCGFSTASGGNITLKKEFLQKAKSVFDEKDIGSFYSEIKSEPFKQFDNNFNLKSALSTEDELIKCSAGFSTASGLSIKTSERSLRKALASFDEDLKNKEAFQIIKERTSKTSLIKEQSIKPSIDFSTTSVMSTKPSDESIRKTGFLFDENFNNKQTPPVIDKPIIKTPLTEKQKIKPMSGFSAASGSNIRLSDQSLQKRRALLGYNFDKENSVTDEKLFKPFADFTTASGSNINLSEGSLRKAHFLFNDDFSSTDPEIIKNSHITIKEAAFKSVPGFSTASGAEIIISDADLKKAKQRIFATKLDNVSAIKSDNSSKVCKTSVYDVSNDKSESFSMKSDKSFKLTESDLELVGDFLKADDLTAFVGNNIDFNENEYSSALEPMPCNISKSSTDSPSTSSKSSGHTSNDWDQTTVEHPDLSGPKSTKRKRLGISAVPKQQIRVKTENLQRAVDFFKKSNVTATETLYSSTPIKSKPLSAKIIIQPNLGNLNLTPVESVWKPQTFQSVRCNSFVYKAETPGSCDDWLKRNREDYENLQKRLKILDLKQITLEIQNQSSSNEKRPTVGLLMEKKKNGPKIPLTKFLKGLKPASLEQAVTLGLSQNVLELTPLNAGRLHFNFSAKSEGGIIKTCEGALVVSNQDDLIGLSEIKAGFLSMPGVDCKLLPMGWIENHYKWIVWKLASYERNFPVQLNGSLSIENIIEQLKYRYDREIDKAERPALRKIYEGDDVCEKRMVLCVSDIIKIAQENYELELTDGWYCIKAVLDPMLCRMIRNSKIVIGTKLVVQGAKLLNCDNCYPLNAPEHVRLKINYNSTRRAAWHAKLGYQKVVQPFPIKIASVHPNGGVVNCLRVYIARVYPIKYFEKLPNGSVWRNLKAEEKRLMDFERMRYREAEKLQCRALERLDNDASISFLYDLGEEKVVEREKEELFYDVTQGMMCRQILSREVAAMLQLLVIDADALSDQAYVLNVWNANDEHQDMLREGNTFLVYNVSPKMNGELSTSSRTYFKSQPTDFESTRQYQRFTFPIATLPKLQSKLLFNQFDTVGLIIRLKRSQTNQELWLSDSETNLLLITIPISSDLLCLFDNVSPGASIALLNLRHKETKKAYGEATGGYQTSITKFPRSKSLTEDLDFFNQQLPKNLTHLMKQCNEKIDGFLTSKGALNGREQFLNNSCEEDTLTQSRLTTTDVAMSLIDTDQYLH